VHRDALLAARQARTVQVAERRAEQGQQQVHRMQVSVEARTLTRQAARALLLELRALRHHVARALDGQSRQLQRELRA
jgi:hypothetical protein